MWTQLRRFNLFNHLIVHVADFFTAKADVHDPRVEEEEDDLLQKQRRVCTFRAARENSAGTQAGRGQWGPEGAACLLW